MEDNLGVYQFEESSLQPLPTDVRIKKRYEKAPSSHQMP